MEESPQTAGLSSTVLVIERSHGSPVCKALCFGAPHWLVIDAVTSSVSGQRGPARPLKLAVAATLESGGVGGMSGSEQGTPFAQGGKSDTRSRPVAVRPCRTTPQAVPGP